MNRSLLGKFWLAMVILVIIMMFLLGFFLSQFFENFYFSLKSQELARNGARIADMIASSPGRLEWEEELYQISKYIDAKVVITDKAGLVRANTINGEGVHKGQRLNYPDVEKILNGEIVAQRGTYPGIEATVLSVGAPIKHGGSVIGAVFLYSPVEPVTNTVGTVQLFILYGATGTILLATVLGFILSKNITRPIQDMNRVAMEMAKGNFKERVVSDSEDELGLLGKTLNFLSAELESNIDALSTGKDQLESILTSMTDAVVTFDVKGDILLINPPARELFDFKTRVQGPNTIDNLNIPELKEKFHLALKEKSHYKSETVIGQRAFSLNIAPLRHSNGDVRGIVAVLHDITKEKRLESLRREFVANVSHELRSPLSLLQGYVEALSDGLAEDEEQRQKYLNILLDETLRLRRLVNDLLDLTQLETGNINMKLEKIAVGDLVYRVTGRFQPLFEEQHKNIITSIPEDLPLIMGDEDKLQQVLVNLLDNAIKYTPQHGTVRVTAFYGISGVEISVADSGPGIPSEELSYIWERFYKVDKSRTRETEGGTGLGLAIAKNIVRAHGGEVSATSEPGKGAKFTFNIPIA